MRRPGVLNAYLYIVKERYGQRLAVAQSYKARTAKESRYVEAFGSREPVGAVDGRVKHLLELTRVCVTGAALRERVDFYALTDFNVVIAKPDRRVIYSGCQWTEISEAASAGDLLFETVTIAASRRMEVAV